MQQPGAGMTVDECLLWAEGQRGRHEFEDGQVGAMAPERVGLAEAKFALQRP